MSDNKLQSISTGALIEELEKRKKVIIPNLVTEINDKLDLLKRLGVKIIDSEEADLSLHSLSIIENPEGITVEVKLVEL